MSKTIKNLHQLLDRYGRTPESYGVHLRLDLAQLVIQGLKAEDWTHLDLALHSGVDAAVINRILHSDLNCSFATAGKLLFALGIKATLVQEQAT